MIRLLGGVMGLIGVFWLAIAGGYAVWWYDRRPLDVPPPYVVHVLFWHQSIGLPESLQSQVNRSDAKHQALLAAMRDKMERQDEQINALNAKYQALETTKETEIHEHTRYIIKEIPLAVPASLDPYLANGWVRIHNEAASGGVSQDAPASASTDGSPSSFKTSDALKTVAENYGECLADQSRLVSLQAYVQDLLKLYGN